MPGWRKVALLLALYLVQGLPFGFQATALPVFLRASGVSLTGIGLLGFLALPWLLKFLWAPLVDRYAWAPFGRRRSWIVPMQAGLAGTCFVAAGVDPGSSLTTLLALVFLMNLFAATQDIAVDGLAVDLLGPGELGPGNAAQVVGYKVGMLTGGGLLVWATRHVGWPGLFLGMGLLVSAVLLVVLFVREPTGTPESAPRATLREVFGRLRVALTLPRTGWLLAVVATYKLGESLADTMFKPFLVDAGFQPADIGLWLGTWGMAASLLGSAAGGYLARRFAFVAAVALAGALRVGPLLAQAVLALGTPSADAVIAVTLAEHFFGGVLTTTMFALMMSWVDPRIGATHYTLLASVEVLGKSPGAWASGPLAESIGYAGTFGIAAFLSAAFLGLLVPLRNRTAPSA